MSAMAYVPAMSPLSQYGEVTKGKKVITSTDAGHKPVQLGMHTGSCAFAAVQAAHMQVHILADLCAHNMQAAVWSL